MWFIDTLSNAEAMDRRTKEESHESCWYLRLQEEEFWT
jgi:hypothetical protein